MIQKNWTRSGLMVKKAKIFVVSFKNRVPQ